MGLLEIVMLILMCDLGDGQGRKKYDLTVVFLCQVDKGSVIGSSFITTWYTLESS